MRLVLRAALTFLLIIIKKQKNEKKSYQANRYSQFTETRSDRSVSVKQQDVHRTNCLPGPRRRKWKSKFVWIKDRGLKRVCLIGSG